MRPSDRKWTDVAHAVAPHNHPAMVLVRGENSMVCVSPAVSHSTVTVVY